MNEIITIKVTGDFACFTNPALKTERSTYPIITPSAADGICRSIFWHPGLKYEITQIDLLSEPKTQLIMKNELKFENKSQILISKERTQRYTEVLINPAYIIHVRQVYEDGLPDEKKIKYSIIFKRRIKKHQNTKQPFFGIKEYFCDVEFADLNNLKPLDYNLDIGAMFHYYLYEENGFNKEPRFFDAKIINGSMAVPPLPERYNIKMNKNYVIE